MILSGRTLSRAWLAVACAASDDDGRPAFFRTVHVEQHPTGVRLVATDSYWLATCWVPDLAHADDLGELEPDHTEVPESTVTIIDDEWRVRDLFKHVAKLTKKADSNDIPVTLNTAASTYDEARPTLTPEMAAKRVRVDVPDERIMARVWDGEWPNWRTLAQSFESAPRTGAATTALSGWMLAALAKVATITAAPVVSIDWIDSDRGLWRISESPLDFEPSGLLMANRSAKPPAPDDDTIPGTEAKP